MTNIVPLEHKSLIEFEELALEKVARFSMFNMLVPQMLKALDYDKRAQAAVEGMVELQEALDECFSHIENEFQSLAAQLEEGVTARVTMTSEDDGNTFIFWIIRRANRIFIKDFRAERMEHLETLRDALVQGKANF